MQVVLWCPAELDLPFEPNNAGYIHGVVNMPVYPQMSPNDFATTLIDGSASPLFETGAVLRYLASQYVPNSFWLSDPIECAHKGK